MACSVFRLLQFASSQIHVRLSKEETSGGVQLSLVFSQSLVQCLECHLFLPGGLLGEGQVKEGVACDIRHIWREPSQRGLGTLQARLSLPCKILELTPQDRH